ncbi:MAG: thioredoxin family protein [Aureisphaera sp.]
MFRYTLLLSLFFLCNITALGQEWLNDIDEAKNEAISENKLILLVFQGSDWCAPCIKLDKEIWSSDTFRSYAEDHFVMLQADFPRRKKNALPASLQQHNNSLAETYNPNGIFPFVVILDGNGKTLGETGYKKMAPEAYISHINSFIQ